MNALCRDVYPHVERCCAYARYRNCFHARNNLENIVVGRAEHLIQTVQDGKLTERLPQRRQSVCDLLWRLPKLAVPLPTTCEQIKNEYSSKKPAIPQKTCIYVSCLSCIQRYRKLSYAVQYLTETSMAGHEPPAAITTFCILYEISLSQQLKYDCSHASSLLCWLCQAQRSEP
jgi:hypothetical protein